jgi:RHS repeat-associated protein
VTNSGALNGTTSYYLDGEQEIEEHNAAGVLTQQYVFGVGVNEPLVLDRNLTGDSTATGPGDQRLFYNRNALGSTMALTDTAGHILEGYQYDAYGRQIVYTPGVSGIVTFSPADVITPGGTSHLANPFLFAGMRLDAETNLYYVRARYLNPLQTRFLERDPLGASPGQNLYEYAADSPANYVDPLGLTLYRVELTVTLSPGGIAQSLGQIFPIYNNLPEAAQNRVRQFFLGLVGINVIWTITWEGNCPDLIGQPTVTHTFQPRFFIGQIAATKNEEVRWTETESLVGCCPNSMDIVEIKGLRGAVQASWSAPLAVSASGEVQVLGSGGGAGGGGGTTVTFDTAGAEIWVYANGEFYYRLTRGAQGSAARLVGPATPTIRQQRERR